jgi:3-oxoacyl-[acyl-carrier-protein] synthase-1
MQIKPLILSAYTVASGMGLGVDATYAALHGDRSGLTSCDFEGADPATWIGRVEALEDAPLTGEWQPFDCRNNRLVRVGLELDGFDKSVQAAREKYGARRIGVFLGTSTSGIQQTELAYAARETDSDPLPDDYRFDTTHNTFSLVDFTRRYLGLEGPAAAISTACSSGAKVFATAHRYMSAGLCDAAVVGGADSLCLTTLYGFAALGLVSRNPCKPWDRERDGINIGEAAGFALLEWPRNGTRGPALVGYGESNDAYHMTAPHPEGAGASLCMQKALDGAGAGSGDVDYINLHGTGTQSNDASEDLAVAQLFGSGTPCSSTKGWTGHTLGAAGVVEAIIAAIAIERNFIPRSLNTEHVEPGLSANIQLESSERQVDLVLSNSFGFGGNNCSLLLGRA